MKRNYQKKLQGLRFDEQSLILLVFYLGQQIFQHIQWRQKISILSSRVERRFLYFNHLSKEVLEQMIPHLKALI